MKRMVMWKRAVLCMAIVSLGALLPGCANSVKTAADATGMQTGETDTLQAMQEPASSEVLETTKAATEQESQPPVTKEEPAALSAEAFTEEPETTADEAEEVGGGKSYTGNQRNEVCHRTGKHTPAA